MAHVASYQYTDGDATQSCMFAPKQAVPDRPLIKGRSEASAQQSVPLYQPQCGSVIHYNDHGSADQLECICFPFWRAGAILSDTGF